MNNEIESSKYAKADNEQIIVEHAGQEPLEFTPDATILNHYKIIELLGSGGMGSVYKVEDVETGAKFALKFLHKQQSNDATWKRFDNEVRAANKLDHPNLIKVHESGLLPDGQPYFIMDLVEGESLSQILRRQGRLPLAKVLKIFVQVGFALSYAHSNGVVHRDIKPSNIMIQTPTDDATLGSVVKVVDFGIAKLTGHDEFNQQTLTKTGEIFGSPLYMSPEQCMGIAVDHRSDLYSMGCVIFEALTGAPPMVGETALSTMLKHQTENAPSLKEASMGIEFPEKIEQIVARLLAKDINERYQSAHLVTSHLATFESAPLDVGPVSAARPVSIRKGQPQFNRLFLIALFSVIFMCGTMIGYYIPQPQNFIRDVPSFADAKFKEELTKSSPEASHAIASATAQKLRNLADEQEKFSTPLGTGGRVFRFPNFSIGKMNFNGGPKQEAVGSLTSPPQFRGIMFAPSNDFRDHSGLFKRFRADDITFLDLSYPQAMGAYTDGRTASVDALIPHILRLKSIDTLSIDDTQISPENFFKLQELPKLQGIWMCRTNLTGDSLFKSNLLSRLELLCLETFVGAKPVVKEIGKYGQIRDLILRDCDLDLNDIRYLSKCTKLETLDLCANPGVGDDCIALIPPAKLKWLFLSGCSVTPKSIDSFKRFKNLKRLDITTKTWSSKDIARLSKTYPKMRLVF